MAFPSFSFHPGIHLNQTQTYESENVCDDGSKAYYQRWQMQLKVILSKPAEVNNTFVWYVSGSKYKDKIMWVLVKPSIYTYFAVKLIKYMLENKGNTCKN